MSNQSVFNPLYKFFRRDMSEIELLKQDLHKTIQTLGLEPVQIIKTPFDGDEVHCVQLSLPPESNLYLIPSGLYPSTPPMALMSWNANDSASYLPLQWDWQDMPSADKIFNALSKYISGPPPYRSAWGLNIGHPITENAEAVQDHWSRFLISGSKPLPTVDEAPQQRMESSLVHALKSSRVTVVGLGSVGSYMTEQLVRSGLSSVNLIDPDEVEISNLSRTVYTLADIGKKKTDALTDRLKQINPDMAIHALPLSLQSVGGTALQEIIENSTLIIATTDDPQAQSLLNACAFYSQVPIVFVGLYRGAQGGEVIAAIPSLTPCLQCMTGLRRQVDIGRDRVSRTVNYGSNRLEGEIALNSDIQHVSSAALKVVYSLLASLKGADAKVAHFVPNAIGQEKHFLTLGMEPNYWFYPEIFKDTSGQYAFQSVWLTAESSHECPICGSNHIENPYRFLSTPNPDHIRLQID